MIATGHVEYTSWHLIQGHYSSELAGKEHMCIPVIVITVSLSIANSRVFRYKKTDEIKRMSESFSDVR